MHSVNQAVQETVVTVPLMRDFLQFVNELITFLRDSPKRCEIVKKIAEALKCPQTSVRPLCPTRFTVKFSTIDGLHQLLTVLPQVLTTIEEGSSDISSSSKASGFLRRLDDFVFYLALTIAPQGGTL
jgi:hypothetical protein